MKRDLGTKLALAGLGSAISLIFIVLAYFIKNLSLSFYVLSAVGVMFPLTKNFYRESLLAVVAVSIIGFFIVNIAIIPFVLASGFYVVFSIFCYNKSAKNIVIFVVKILYSALIFFVFYQLIKIISIDIAKINLLKTAPSWVVYIVFNIIFSAAFVLYDYVIIKGYLYLKKLLHTTK